MRQALDGRRYLEGCSFVDAEQEGTWAPPCSARPG
jgi:hypothetical protein